MKTYMHIITVAGRRYHVASQKDRYLTQEELNLWMGKTRRIIHLEQLGSEMDRRNEREMREDRDKLGLIVPGDYGMDKSPRGILTAALNYYIEHQDDVANENWPRTGSQYISEDLWPEIYEPHEELTEVREILEFLCDTDALRLLKTVNTILINANPVRYWGMDMSDALIDYIDRLRNTIPVQEKIDDDC